MGLSQGAEAIVERRDDRLIKRRVKKRYRHPSLDRELRQSRARKEKKMLEQARGLIPVPQVFSGDDEVIEMAFLDGPMLKESFDKKWAFEAGRHAGLLHKHDMIHGDLTTSNMIIYEEKLYLIDFGLSNTSAKPEDKAVDVHLFKQSLESKHHAHAQEAYARFVKGYEESYPDSKAVFDRLEKVELRGRNKTKKKSIKH